MNYAGMYTSLAERSDIYDVPCFALFAKNESNMWNVYLRTQVLHGFSILLFFGTKIYSNMKGNFIHVYARISYE